MDTLEERRYTYDRTSEFTGRHFEGGAPGQGSRDIIPNERLPAPGHHHGLRQLCGGTGDGRAAADDLQARHLHPGPHPAPEGRCCCHVTNQKAAVFPPFFCGFEKEERGDNLPKIETPRLILRPFEERDYDDLYEFLSQRREDQFEAYPDITYENGREHLRYRLGSGDFFAMELKESGKVIGNIYYGTRDFQAREVGYIVNKNYQRKGYAS